jgi:phage-related protein
MSDRPLAWVGTCRDDLRAFPEEIRRAVGLALRYAQRGLKSPSAKPLKGFGGAAVLEIVEDDDGDTYRAVYAVALPDAIYVLHAFQKKSTHGIRTPPRELATIRRRLREAQERSARIVREQQRNGHERRS